jgi:hypothetical protein
MMKFKVLDTPFDIHHSLFVILRFAFGLFRKKQESHRTDSIRDVKCDIC